MTQLDLLKATSKYIDAIIEDERKELIEKACEWLKNSTILAETTIERFRLAMEE